MSVASPAPRTTPRGTPCAASWDDAWVAQVEAREQGMDRRICGARTIGGTPCPLPSDHASGRCRHHGGFALTGAPADNRNAVVHGLYSRRLMICGSHCPAWQSCPMGGGSTFAADEEKAGSGGMGFQPVRNEGPTPVSQYVQSNDVDVGSQTDAAGRTGWKPMPPKPSRPLNYAQYLLKLPLSERPICPYETSEYNATVTDMMKRTQAQSGNAMGLHVAHQVALLTVMVSRAVRALATKPFTEKMEQTAENYYMSVERPSASLIAFEKLSRELRRWIHLIEREYQIVSADRATEREHELRQQCDTGHDPDWTASLDLTNALAQKESAKHTAHRNAALDEIDQKIVDSLFARFGVKPQASTTKDTKSTKEGNDLNEFPHADVGAEDG